MKRYTRVWRRETANAWPLLQAAAAATLAWLIATHLARHHQPFFAPIAAVLALATFTAMFIARHIGGARVMIAQAAASAILTVALARGEAGTQRLGDALIGGGVALMFSQVFFSPEPVRLIRRATVAALKEMGYLLALTTRSLDEDANSHNPDSILDSARELRERLGELAHMMRAADHVVRHSVYWRSRSKAVARETAAAKHLELLGGSLLMLARIAIASEPSERRELVPVVARMVAADLIAFLGEDASEMHRVPFRP